MLKDISLNARIHKEMRARFRRAGRRYVTVFKRGIPAPARGDEDKALISCHLSL